MEIYMTDIKIRIDFNVDPNLDNKAKQVVYLEKTFDEIDITNLIGKKIINVEYETFHNCLILTLVDEKPLPTIISDDISSDDF